MSVDGELIYSKLKSGQFPDPAQVSPAVVPGKRRAAPTFTARAKATRVIHDNMSKYIILFSLDYIF